MYKTIFYTHQIVVTLFLLIYLIKTIMLLTNSNERLARFIKMTKVPEMIISVLFLATGVYMIIQMPEINSLMLMKLVAVFASIPIAVVGFKKGNKALASLALILIISAYGLAEMSKKRGAKAVDTAAATSVDGQVIYNSNCARCHGQDGKLGASGALDLSVSTLDKAQAVEIVSKGKGAMVGFQEPLSAEQIDAVTDYVMTLRK